MENKLGLSSEEVKQRILNKQTNKTKNVVGKTIPKILATNLLSIFNVLLLIIAVFIIIAGKFSSLAFFFIYLVNIGIGLYQDFKAYFLLNKLKLVVEPKTIAIRDGKEKEILVNDIVLDDVLVISSSNQISTDGEILDGEVGINESLLTGESKIVYKKKGDKVLSGTFVVSGSATMLVTHVGKDNYAYQLQKNAAKNKASQSEIKKTLNWLFKILGIVVLVFAAMLIITNLDGLKTNFKDRVGTIAGSLVAMIPAGLFLLSSIALAIGAINLGKKKALVQNFYSIEMLARSTTLCLDKTGTITDGKLEVSEFINISKLPDETIKSLLFNLVNATKDVNATASAIINYFQTSSLESRKVIDVLPFCSENKYSAVSFESGTFVFGALEFLNCKNKNNYLNQISPYLEKGLRVLCFGKSKGKIVDKKVTDEVEILSFIILKDHIKEDAVEIFKWFNINKVNIKVISGDNALSVSEVAKEAGIEGAEEYISLEGKTIEEVKSLATQYNVFGRVTPEQKEAIVDGLKEAGEFVAMTGDGVNDILALRKADCSIAMASGSEASKNVSQIILIDSNFSSLPDIVSEGRRVVNNLQRTSSLFLCKTVFAVVATLIFLILQWCGVFNGYPFEANNLYLWELTSIGLGSLFLSIEPNNEPIKGSFFKDILKICIPSGLMMVLAVIVVYICYANKFIIGYESSAKIVCSFLFAIVPLSTLYLVCSPFDKYRKIVFFSVSGFNVLCLIIQGVLSYSHLTNEPLKIDFTSISPIQYCLILVLIVGFVSLYLGINNIEKLIRSKKEDSLNNHKEENLDNEIKKEEDNNEN